MLFTARRTHTCHAMWCDEQVAGWQRWEEGMEGIIIVLEC